MSKFNAGQSFADGDIVTGAKLNNITGLLDIYTGLISEQTAIVATVSTADQLLIADTDNGDSGAANRVTVQKLLNDTLTNGTYTNAQLSGNLNVTQLSTLGTISSTTGTIQTLTSSTANISQGSAIFTKGTIATLNSTTGTIGTLVATGTITGSTNVVNIGSGQIYKDATGNVGIGVTSLISSIHVKQATPVSKITLEDLSTNRVGQIGGGSDGNGGFLSFLIGNNGGSIAEAMRIDSSANLLVGGTNTEPAGNSTSGVAIKPPATSANGMVEICNANLTALVLGSTTGDATLARFRRAGAPVGSISVTAGATAFVTSSDYRLKTNLEPISNGIERIKQLPVYRFNWIADQSGNKVDGFVAHEAQPIVPEAILGAKDEIDAEGNPIYQGIDQSKIVPLLTAALKEAITKIEVLESKVAALEAA
jgi:hypothetical protein